MTEQENREKAIEEMAKIACAIGCNGSCNDECPSFCKGYGRLYDAGYRKEEEVRKEVAREIYKALLGTEHIKELEQKEHCEWWVSRWRLEDLNRVFKEFGVEVEE